jgi:SecD/SecF fusion protein
MRILIRNIIIVVATLLLAIYSIIPPEKQLRLGKDLRGGVSLIYTVLIQPGDPPDVVERVIEVLKKRVDPNGLSEISIVKNGQNRIEITMPLPNAKVKKLKEDYEAELRKIQASALDDSGLQLLLRTPPAERDLEIKRIAAGDAAREELLRAAATAYDASTSSRTEYNRLRSERQAAADAGADAAALAEFDRRINEAEEQVVTREIAFDKAKQPVLSATLTPAELRRALALSNEPRAVTDSVTGQRKRLPSPQERALATIRAKYPSQLGQLDRVLAAYDRFAAERTRLDDPADLKRMLSGAGVLDFRITVDPNSHLQEQRLRQELRERGPRNVQATDARWYAVNKLDTWFDSSADLEFLEADPASYFRDKYQMVAERYEDQVYILCYDVPGSRLTRAEGDWAVASAMPSRDPQTGSPAISFEMNNRGAGLLQSLTKANVGKHMAVMLDDEVYTAPNLRSAIGKSGQITGTFSEPEILYIVNVLAAGSLQAKLSPEPISEANLAPELGADNLRAGLKAGVYSLILVMAFMVVYYFSSGVIACVALLYNFILVLGVMSLNEAAFTMPGIAGVVLTFGQAIDSNVLIYERMREEFNRGADMRTAVRLGFSRAFSPIMDGNLSNLIICAVLYFFGTQEIRGFAITLGIGVVTTLFTALIVSRLIFTIFVDHLGWRKASQLPMAWPLLQRMLTPNVDWMKHRWTFMGILVAMVLGFGALIWSRGTDLLDTQFTGGTQIEIQLKSGPDGKPITMSRAQVQERFVEIGTAAAPDSDLRVLLKAEVVPVNPRTDGFTSDRFKIRTDNADGKTILAAISHRFEDVMESRGALTFTGIGAENWHAAPVRQIISPVLGENLDRPALGENVREYIGGVAIVLDGLAPPPSKDALIARLNDLREDPDYEDTLPRLRTVMVLEGNDAAVRSAVVLVHDDAISSFSDLPRWEREVAAREWQLTREALSRTSQLASVQTFSPAIASTFTAQAVVSGVLSLLLLTIYVWVRFGTVRWAVAATVPLFADVVIMVGALAAAGVLYESPSTNGVARTLMLLPFKFDLEQIAALLTIVGYSLNDKIIILDRIRENKGKTPYVSYAMVNDSINQTISRTVITAGTTLISTAILYLFGGEGVRGFAFTFNLGIILGTFTSVVSSPLVWSGRFDPTMRRSEGSDFSPAGGAAA